MTCRHRKYDPACTSHQAQMAELEADYQEQIAGKRPQPDFADFEILDVREVGKNLVLRVRYPSCPDCQAEKVIVYANCATLRAIKWRTIDPHFKRVTKIDAREAPSPAARFPGSDDGWMEALRYAETLGRPAMVTR